MDLAVNEEFTRMYSEEELMGARRIQVHVAKSRGNKRTAMFPGHRTFSSGVHDCILFVNGTALPRLSMF